MSPPPKTSLAALDTFLDDLMKEHFALAIGASAAVQDAIEKIDLMIGHGTLAPSERLVEADLCKQLGISRGPIREALRILAGDGVIELVINRGARVRRLSNKEIMDRSAALSALYCSGIESFTEQAGEFFDRGMETLRYVSKQIQAIDKLAHPMAFMFKITQYHVAINHFSGNEFLNSLVSRLHVHHFQRQLAAAMNVRFLIDSGTRYRSITDALEVRNAPKAIKLTRAIESALSQKLV